MKKDVLISISGIQFSEGANELAPMETVVAGEYYQKNGAHFLMYDEIVEEWGQPIHNFIKIRGGSVEIRRRGLLNTHMVFEQDKKSMTSYRLPFGEMKFGISTTGVKVEEESEWLTALVNYALDIDGKFFADCEVHIDVRQKEAAAELLSE